MIPHLSRKEKLQPTGNDQNSWTSLPVAPSEQVSVARGQASHTVLGGRRCLYMPAIALAAL